MKQNAKYLMILIAAFMGMIEVANAFYDPGLQRWINRDPILEQGGINLYSIVGNDLQGRIDLLGLYDPDDPKHKNPVGDWPRPPETPIPDDPPITDQSAAFFDAAMWGSIMKSGCSLANVGYEGIAARIAARESLAATRAAAEAALQKALQEREATRAALKQAGDILEIAEKELRSSGGAMSEGARNIWRSAQNWFRKAAARDRAAEEAVKKAEDAMRNCK